MNIYLQDSTVLLVAAPESASYPINRLRNLAIKHCKTQFMFLIDADFQPSPNLENEFSNILAKYYSGKAAFVVPAFEYLESPNVRNQNLKVLTKSYFFSEKRSNSKEQR